MEFLSWAGEAHCSAHCSALRLLRDEVLGLAQLLLELGGITSNFR